ncbi:MAG TPA: S41 family peptidase, partial [Acholeplasma sp.]
TEPTKNGYAFRYWYSNNANVPYDFTLPVTANLTLKAKWSTPDVVLSEVRTVPFTNLTTEFEVSNGELDLYFTDGGSVPYVRIADYFELLTGFIDPALEITFEESETKLVMSYQYYSEEEDHTYDLINEYDLKTNLITTNDPGFYWAYIYSTATNYGRNIEYLYDSDNNEYIEGGEIIYNLNDYNLDIVYHDGGVLAPYYLVNQLYAGSSYYNVYYNGDALFGFYGQLSPGSVDYNKIRRSTFNNTAMPQDLKQHTYDMFAFDLDYFYGLKEYEGVNSYYTLISKYYTSLFSPDYKVTAQAIADILLKEMDEPHTSYGFSGYFAATSFQPPTNSLSNYGPRFNSWYMDGLYAVDDAIAAKWNITSTSSWAANSSKRPKYWFIDDNSAVISFDGFDTADIIESKTWSDKAYQEVFGLDNILPTFTVGNRFFAFNQSTLKDDVVETLIWGATQSDIDTYKTSLTNNGWTSVKENTTKTDYHKDGYYTKSIGDVTFMATLAYNSLYKTVYIGLTSTVPSNYEANWVIKSDIVGMIESDSAIYIEAQIKKILEEKPNVKNIGLDLTFNTGGNVGALYRVVGLMTSEPFAVSSISNDTKSKSTTYITTSYEAYDNVNWFLLTSKATFSAANELATIFKQNKLGLIIGQKSGGGAASITPILLPDGTFFTMSSNNLNAIRLEDGTYVINEAGIDPDVVVSYNDIFKNSVLADILN